jgi:oligopeptide transport system substrate-binding protein
VYDPRKARALLAEAGFPGGAGLGEIEILFNTRDDHLRVAQAIGAMWKENLGVEVKLANQESKVFGESMRNLRYTVCRAGWFGDYGDANTFLDMFQTGNGNNETGYASRQYDDLIARAAAELDPARRAELFQEAERILLDDAPILPLYVYTNKYLIRPNVGGISRNPRNIITARCIYRLLAGPGTDGRDSRPQ